MKKYKVVERWNDVTKRKHFWLYRRLPYLTIVKNVLFFASIFLIWIFGAVIVLVDPTLLKGFPSIRELLDCLLWLEIDAFDTLEDAAERINEIEEIEGRENIYWF